MSDLKITLYIEKLAILLNKFNYIAPEIYKKYDIQRGLRDIEGNSTVAGLTKISCVKSESNGAMLYLNRISRIIFNLTCLRSNTDANKLIANQNFTLIQIDFIYLFFAIPVMKLIVSYK